MDNSAFSLEPFHQRVPKPWGYEMIFTPPGLTYTAKVLVIDGGKKISFQYHDQKIETLILFRGNALIWLEDETGEIQKVPMELHKGYTVAVGQKHRVEAIEESWVMEGSLPETGTTVRIEDDYARPDETEDLRQDPRRGWLD
jgi:mannose-6-phosphate isomerase-like protein (cupin superfamily)